jgi:septum formation protein
MHFYLASSSPRRKELFTQLIGEQFTIVKSTYEEDNTLPLSPRDLVTHHAGQKARTAIIDKKEGIIIAADTLVALGNKVLGKPKNPADAKKQLEEQRGKTISVFTGLCLKNLATGKESLSCEEAQLHVAKYSDEVINLYLATGEPMDKAGSFGIQGKGAVLIEKIEGDYYNIMGLPLCTLHKLLKEMGVPEEQFFKN